jgi:aldehyde dehydrogenase (NAD+)
MRMVAQHYINGEFVDPHGTEQGESYRASDGELLGRTILGDAEDAGAAVAAAKAAFPGWSQTSLAERGVVFDRISAAIEDHRDEIVAGYIEEFGGPREFAGYTVDQAVYFFQQAKQLAADFPFEERIGEAVVRRVPLGVAALITPWNGSAWFIAVKTAAALVAGNTVVIKPSNLAPFQTDGIVKAFAAAGIPPGVVNVVYGKGDTVGSALTGHPDVAKISFTGSTRIGKQIARDGVETMKRVTLELGGKAPTIVLDDVDMKQGAMFAVTSGLFNSGQSCIAGSRILIPASREEEAIAAIKESIESLKVGDPGDADTVVGAMITQEQYDKIQGYIRSGIEEGATLLTGGEGHPEGLGGYFVKPTVFTGVTSDMTIAREEIFGPVLSVLTYTDDDDAVRIANDTPFGLHAYVAAGDPKRGEAIAQRIQAGRVMVNRYFDAPDAPFGGFKQSGIGREFGRYGLQAYLETQATFVD